jgi:hypothetical protein
LAEEFWFDSKKKHFFFFFFAFVIKFLMTKKQKKMNCPNCFAWRDQKRELEEREQRLMKRVIASANLVRHLYERLFALGACDSIPNPHVEVDNIMWQMVDQQQVALQQHSWFWFHQGLCQGTEIARQQHQIEAPPSLQIEASPSLQIEASASFQIESVASFQDEHHTVTVESMEETVVIMKKPKPSFQKPSKSLPKIAPPPEALKIAQILHSSFSEPPKEECEKQQQQKQTTKPKQSKKKSSSSISKKISLEGWTDEMISKQDEALLYEWIIEKQLDAKGMKRVEEYLNQKQLQAKAKIDNVQKFLSKHGRMMEFMNIPMVFGLTQFNNDCVVDATPGVLFCDFAKTSLTLTVNLFSKSISIVVPLVVKPDAKEIDLYMEKVRSPRFCGAAMNMLKLNFDSIAHHLDDKALSLLSSYMKTEVLLNLGMFFSSSLMMQQNDVDFVEDVRNMDFAQDVRNMVEKHLEFSEPVESKNNIWSTLLKQKSDEHIRDHVSIWIMHMKGFVNVHFTSLFFHGIVARTVKHHIDVFIKDFEATMDAFTHSSLGDDRGHYAQAPEPLKVMWAELHGFISMIRADTGNTGLMDIKNLVSDACQLRTTSSVDDSRFLLIRNERIVELKKIFKDVMEQELVGEKKLAQFFKTPLEKRTPSKLSASEYAATDAIIVFSVQLFKRLIQIIYSVNRFVFHSMSVIATLSNMNQIIPEFEVPFFQWIVEQGDGQMDFSLLGHHMARKRLLEQLDDYYHHQVKDIKHMDFVVDMIGQLPEGVAKVENLVVIPTYFKHFCNDESTRISELTGDASIQYQTLREFISFCEQ